MINPIKNLKKQYEEIKRTTFGTNLTPKERLPLLVFQSSIQPLMEDARIDKISKANFNKAIKDLPNDFEEFILITNPIMEEIEELFKSKETKPAIPLETEWGKQIERMNPGLAKHQKKLRKKH
jgi:hypothetical protein